MIPIHLTIQAFGPYKGKEEIDFTKFFKEKLFLITGNTGSGKTMIFDAICYALFGEASGQYRKVDTLRSQFAEKNTLTYVEFEFLHRDEKYKITREPEQIKISRGKEVPHRQTAKIIIGNEIITGIKKVNEVIKDILSIDYSQFKQIVMIAQGEFRKLVSADSKEREGIYRRIFNTMNFENVQNILKDRTSRYDKKLDNLNQKINGLLESIHNIKKISYDDFTIEQIIEQLGDEIKIYESYISDTKNKKEHLKSKFADKTNLFNKFKELKEYNEKMSRIDIESLKKESSFLDNVKKTFSITEKESILNSLKQMKQGYIEYKNELSINLEKLESDLGKYEDELKKSFLDDEKIETLKNEIIKLESLKNSVDEKIEYEKQINDLNNKILILEDKNKNFEKEILELNKVKDDITNFTLDNKNVKEDILKFESNLNRINKLHKLFSEYDYSLKIYNELVVKSNSLEEKYDKTFNEYKMKSSKFLDAEDLYFRNQSGFLAKKLEDNMPCMVCGSTIHPNKAKIIDINITEEMIKYIRNECDNIKSDLDKIKEDKINVDKDKDFKSNTIQRIYKELIELDLDKRFIRFDILGKSYDINSEIREEINSITCDLEDKNKIYEKLLQCEEQLNKINSDILNKNSLKDNIKNDLLKLESEKSSIDVILRDRELKLSEYNIVSRDDYINILNSHKLNLNNLIKNKESIEFNISKCKEDLTNVRSKFNMKNKDIDDLDVKIKSSYEELINEIKENGFNDFDEYTSFKIPKDEFDKRDKYLEDMRIKYRSLKESILKLKDELKILGNTSLDEFTDEIKNLELELNKIEEYEKKIYQSISSLENVYNTISSINKEISDSEAYKTNLNELSKIANGNNKQKISFERYILGIYFKEIINSANIRLLKLTNGRYLFRHLKDNIDLRSQQGLDISVFDNKTSQERKINAISGGESFQASLALALGLSDVIQRYSGGVSIDTLFIDEGFGSLDSDSLQNALNCLIEANNESKLIGIVSHIQELKDFIRSKIEVIDSHEGSIIRTKN